MVRDGFRCLQMVFGGFRCYSLIFKFSSYGDFDTLNLKEVDNYGEFL